LEAKEAEIFGGGLELEGLVAEEELLDLGANRRAADHAGAAGEQKRLKVYG